MHLYRLGESADTKAVLEALGVESGGVKIISQKMDHYRIMIKDLKTPAVNILKQDALSIGAELAVPSGVILCEEAQYDCLLIGNRRQIKRLSRKELAQPFGLKQVAVALSEMLQPYSYPQRIMGVLNANDDSFYAGSRFMPEEALERITEMIDEGADIIDIGAVSSRPGSQPVDEAIELARIQPICDAIKAERLHEKVTFSIDSYTPSVVAYALASGFGIVNDITGAADERLVRLAVKHDAQYCIMHMQGTPQTMQRHPRYDDVMAEVSQFFQQRIAQCGAWGLAKEQLILDVGIGFGKTLNHNITLIKNLRHFTHFGCQVLLGASRKSLIDQMSPAPVEERLPGTLALHLKAIENGAHIIRCHDVPEHKQALEILKHIN